MTDSRDSLVRRGFLRRILLAMLVGAVFGWISGYIGVSVEHSNESRFGAEYFRFEFAWLALLAEPGVLATMSINATHDWCVDEAWQYRITICAWNALFWCGLALLAAVFYSGVIGIRRRITPPPTAASRRTKP